MLVRRTFANSVPPLDCSSDPSRTRQEFTHDADINNIVRRFLRDGVLPLVNANRPLETDGLSLLVISRRLARPLSTSRMRN